MPGMMDTILNLGLNDDAVEGLAAATGQRALRLRRLPPADPDVRGRRRRHRRASSSSGSSRPQGRARRLPGRRSRGRRTCASWSGASAGSTRSSSGETFPQDARDQLERAVRAVFDSWETPRAQVYRRANQIPDDLGTAVNVVQMVFGNKGDDSGTGVGFTRDPSTGQAGHVGRVPRQRAGRGRRRRDPHARADRGHGGAFSRGLRAARRARWRGSRSTTARCRTSSSRSRRGRSTSCRPAPASARPPPRCASRSTWSATGLITQEEAVARIDPAQLDQLLHPMIDPRPTTTSSRRA